MRRVHEYDCVDGATMEKDEENANLVLLALAASTMYGQVAEERRGVRAIRITFTADAMLLQRLCSVRVSMYHADPSIRKARMASGRLKCRRCRWFLPNRN